MALIEWDEAFSVNNPELDAQHEKWVGIINSLHAGLRSNDGDAAAVKVEALAAMMDYARRHFMAEEKYMREIGFPGTIAHIKLHNEFYGEVAAHLLAAEGGGEIPAVGLLRFLRGWLIEHILNEDKKYSRYIAGAGGPGRWQQADQLPD